MVQLAGGVTADQLNPIVLDDDAVAVSPPGADGTVLQLPPELPRISMPITSGWLAAPTVKAITIWPLLLAVVLNVSSSAAFLPTVPAMSRLVRTVVPLMATLNRRLPAAVK